MWIASNDHVRIPFIKQKKVFLGSESVKAVEQVDPEEEFGLFAVQKFEVESSSDCEILKVRFGYQLLVCTWRHGGHVGGQKQKHISPLGTKLFFM